MGHLWMETVRMGRQNRGERFKKKILPGESARPGKPLTLEAKGQVTGISRPGLGAWGAVGASCTLREEGRGAGALWTCGMLNF